MSKNHYISNKEFTKMVGDFTDKCRDDGIKHKMPDDIAEKILLLVDRIAKKPNFIRIFI